MNTLARGAVLFAVCLSVLAGCVDAIGFLQLGGHFVSFMSGNSTQLAVGMTNGAWHAVAELGAIIALFVLGAALGTLTAHVAAPPRRAFAVLVLVAGLLGAAALSCALGGTLPGIGLVTLAMGAENAVFQRNGDIVIGLTYMTGTLAKIGQRLAYALTGGPPFAFLPYLLLWLGLVCGGATGALVFRLAGLNGLWLAAAFAAAMAGVAWWNKGV